MDRVWISGGLLLILGLVLVWSSYKKRDKIESFVESHPLIGIPRVMTYTDFKNSVDVKIINKYASKRRITPIFFRTSNESLQKLAPEIVNVLQDAQKIGNAPLVYFDENDRESFIREYYPEYLADYQKLIPGAYRADLWRLLVIYHYGGVYNDITMTYLVDPKQFIHDTDELVLCKDWTYHKPPAIFNAFFAAYPRHPYIKACIESIVKNIRANFYGEDPLDVTGPYDMARSFNRFFGYPLNKQVERGKWVQNGYTIKVFYNAADKYGDIMNGVVVDEQDRDLIRSKIKDHYKLLYKNGHVVRYADLWRSRKMYHSE